MRAYATAALQLWLADRPFEWTMAPVMCIPCGFSDRVLQGQRRSRRRCLGIGYRRRTWSRADDGCSGLDERPRSSVGRVCYSSMSMVEYGGYVCHLTHVRIGGLPGICTFAPPSSDEVCTTTTTRRCCLVLVLFVWPNIQYGRGNHLNPKRSVTPKQIDGLPAGFLSLTSLA